MGEGNAPAQRLARGVVPVRGTVDAVAFEFGWRRDEMEAGADDGGVVFYASVSPDGKYDTVDSTGCQEG